MENRTVDCYIASLWRQGHIVHTVKSILKNPETLTITIVANNYTDQQIVYISEAIAGMNSEYQIPIRIIRSDNKKESNEKMKYVHEGYGTYVSYIDDDLILDPTHFKTLIEGCEKYGAYCSLHGVILHPLPIRSYYADRDVFRALETVIFDIEVDIASNCGSLWRRDFFTEKQLKEVYETAPETGMDDILMATLCRTNNIPRYVLFHKKGFIKHKELHPDDHYIFDKYTKQLGVSDKVQTDFINTYWK